MTPANHRQPITPELIAVIRDQRANGTPLEVIAQTTGRTPVAVKTLIRNQGLAPRFEWSPQLVRQLMRMPQASSREASLAIGCTIRTVQKMRARILAELERRTRNA